MPRPAHTHDSCSSFFERQAPRGPTSVPHVCKACYAAAPKTSRFKSCRSRVKKRKDAVCGRRRGYRDRGGERERVLGGLCTRGAKSHSTHNDICDMGICICHLHLRHLYIARGKQSIEEKHTCRAVFRKKPTANRSLFPHRPCSFPSRRRRTCSWRPPKSSPSPLAYR